MVVFLEDFFVFELELDGSVVVLSVAVSLLGSASVFAADFLELLFFSLELLLVLFDDGLVSLSAAGLLVVFDDLVDAVGEAFVLGVAVAATEAVAAGVIVAPTLAVVAGVALALVEAALLVVVVAPVVVVPVVVVPLVEVTPALKLGVTP